MVFLQHLYQAQEDSHELTRVTKVATQLLEEVDDLKEENEYYIQELKLYENNLIEFEGEVNSCYEKLNRTEMEIEVLDDKVYDLDEIILSLKKEK